MYWCEGCKHVHRITDDWGFSGDLNNPSLVHSVLVSDQDGPWCHAIITNGRIAFLDDCRHDLKGQTLDLPEFKLS